MKIICDWENCDQAGGYRAPVERDNSKKYRLLCLEHIKIFNKKWNYFSNMTDQEVEYFVKSDLTVPMCYRPVYICVNRPFLCLTVFCHFPHNI